MDKLRGRGGKRKRPWREGRRREGGRESVLIFLLFRIEGRDWERYEEWRRKKGREVIQGGGILEGKGLESVEGGKRGVIRLFSIEGRDWKRHEKWKRLETRWGEVIHVGWILEGKGLECVEGGKEGLTGVTRLFRNEGRMIRIRKYEN